MFQRTSMVNNIKMRSVSFASTLQIGDSHSITPVSRALAVQREYEIFFGDEGDFNAFPIFQQPIPQPAIFENIEYTRINESPVIRVHNIDIYGASTSGVVQIGSTNYIQAEARVKHIRQLSEGPFENE